MRIEDEIKLDFCDVLIKPKRSNAPSRASVILDRKFKFLNSKKEFNGIPIIASNMDTVGTFAMAKVLCEQKLCVALHKHYELDDITNFVSCNRHLLPYIFYTTGIKDEDIVKLKKYKEYWDSIIQMDYSKEYTLNICVDVANGYSEYFVDKVKEIRELFPYETIMAGNVCTPEMVQELLLAGSDIIKVGIGGGSACRTRKVAGIGYPQLSAVIECADAAHGLGGHVVSDGGCVGPDDIAKAFGGGADFVMLGGMLSGHEECEGEWKYDYQYCYVGDRVDNVRYSEGEYLNVLLFDGPQLVATFDKGKDGAKYGKKSLKFYGMSSKEAINKHYGGLSDYRAAEGKCVDIPYKGLVKNCIQEILGGLRSCCSYVGATSLKDLSKCTTFVRVNRTHNTVYGN